MKNYCYNPKTQDITIFDTETKEILVLERLLGIRVLTTSDLESPGGDEPVKKWKNHDWDPAAGKAKHWAQDTQAQSRRAREENRRQVEVQELRRAGPRREDVQEPAEAKLPHFRRNSPSPPKLRSRER
jgi:hypothetical protein